MDGWGMILIFAYLTFPVMKLPAWLKRRERMSSDGRLATGSHFLLFAVAEIALNAPQETIKFVTDNSSQGSRIGDHLQNMLQLITRM